MAGSCWKQWRIWVCWIWRLWLSRLGLWPMGCYGHGLRGMVREVSRCDVSCHLLVGTFIYQSD